MDIIKDFIYDLSQTLPMSRDTDSSFYSFVKEEFELYISRLNSLPKEDFERFLESANEMCVNASARRFINLISDIQKQCLLILQSAYKGDLLSADRRLERLLTVQEPTKYRLCDMLVNYFVLRRELGKTFYRCVDFGEGETPNDCWHLPFNLKYKAARGRFNQLGTICMYICNSKECANRELGPVKEQSVRWVGEFKPKQGICLYNLVVPSKEYIENMSVYEQFCFLLTYPFYILCLTKTNHSNGSFCEEYLFSQLFFHMLFLQSNDKCPRFDGICYTSMQTPSAVNIVIPAKYEKEEPPMSGHSKYVKSLLQEVRNPYQYSKDY
jgi:hypothetical protein